MLDESLKYMLINQAFGYLLDHQRIQLKALVAQVDGLTDLSILPERLLDNLETFQQQLANRKARLEGTIELLKEAQARAAPVSGPVSSRPSKPKSC